MERFHEKYDLLLTPQMPLPAIEAGHVTPPDGSYGDRVSVSDGNYGKLPVLATELVRLKVDVLVAFGAKAVVAAKGATTTIPIVVASFW